MEEEATKKKKKSRNRTSSRGVPPSTGTLNIQEEHLSNETAEQDLSIECAILDALMDVEDTSINISINSDQATSCQRDRPIPMSEISVNEVGAIGGVQLPEVNGNGDVQETALIEVVAIAPTAPIIEESLTSPHLIPYDVVSAPEIEQIGLQVDDVSPLVESHTPHHAQYKPLQLNNLLLLYENKELVLSKELWSKLTDIQDYPNQDIHYIDSFETYFNLTELVESDLSTLEEQKNTYMFQVDNVWTFEKRKLTETGECQDGNPVTAELEFVVSHLNKEALETLNTSLTTVKDTCHGTLIRNWHNAELLQKSLTDYIDLLCMGCLQNTNTNTPTPAQLLTESEQLKIKDDVSRVRFCIDLLFKFHRRKLKEDGIFLKVSTAWLIKLVGVCLRVGTWQDHIFILHHVLRIPKRLPDWMKKFVQFPLHFTHTHQSPLESHQLAHLVSVLSILMEPIHDHSHVLEECLYDQSKHSDPSKAQGSAESTWVVVDSDGEEDENGCFGQVAENNIIELFSQIPFDKMYVMILRLQRDDDKYYMVLEDYNDRYMLELFAFCTLLIQLYKRGLRTYGTQTYQQFAKRLGQLINHIVQHVTDAYECCSSLRNPDFSSWPLQYEYDMFVLRAVNAIYSSKNLGMWQFLATLPFRFVSSSTMWQIYYVLHNDYDDNLDKPMPRDVDEWRICVTQSAVLQGFEDRLCSLPESEAMHLLSAFSTMALLSNKDNAGFGSFITTVTLDLFQHGFLSEVLQDRCTKHIQTLLATITATYPCLISRIMMKMTQYNFIDSEQLCLDLFKDLPLDLWMPRDEDLAIIRRWLMDKPLLSTEFSLARLILARLNYDVNRTTTSEERDLVLSHSFHCKVAVMVVEAALLFAKGAGGPPMSGTAALCDMVVKYVNPGSGLDTANKWAWGLLTRLRIHNLDRGHTIPTCTLAAPEYFLKDVPDLYGHNDLQVIATGVLNRHPIACYLALQMTTYGHSVPLICTKGFPLIEVLLRHQMYTEAIKCIQLVVPMFIDCAESLISCDAFQSILIQLCAADKTLMKMAKNLIRSEFPQVLRIMGLMVESHLISATAQTYGPNGLLKMTYVWLKCLAKVPEWTNDSSVLYLMDIILRRAFFCRQNYLLAEQILTEFYLPPSHDVEKEEDLNKGTNPEMFFRWADTHSHPPCKSLMARVSLPATPWFAAYALMIEKHWQESKLVWDHVLLELYDQTGRSNVDAALKRTLDNLRLPIAMSAGSLSIYRWAQQALDTPISNPLLMFFWQMFFLLYLARVPADIPYSKGCVGHKFFEGSVGQRLIKRMKKQLLDTANYYSNLEAVLRAELDEDPTKLNNLQPVIVQHGVWSRLFKTFLLWLEDKRLMECNLVLANLELMYDVRRLELLIDGDNRVWREFMEIAEKEFLAVRNKGLADWQKLLYRHQEPSKLTDGCINCKNSVSPLERISRRLASYETPREPDPLPEPRSSSSAILPDWKLYKDSLLAYVNEHLESLTNCGQMYMRNLAEHTALDCTLQECLPLLYSNVESEKVLRAVCHSSPPHRGTNYHSRESTCAGPAEVRVMVTESKLNTTLSKVVEDNRKEWLDVINCVAKPPRYEACTALYTLDVAVRELVQDYKSSIADDHQRKVVLNELGVTLFFHLVGAYSEALAFFPPSQKALQTHMQLLAQTFLMNGNYVEQLLEVVLEDMRMANIVYSYLVPVEAPKAKFIDMYGSVANKAYCVPDVDSIALVLSQFDVHNWLYKHRTTLVERSALIDEIAKAISAVGLQPDPKKDKINQAFRKDLMTMLLHDFPENFGNVLNHLLKGSASQRVSLDVWYDFINTLIGEKKLLYPGIEHTKLRDEIRRFATEQKSLSYNELLQTAHFLGDYFLKERSNFGLYGLYPKYRTYVEPIMVFQAMIGHALTMGTLAQEQGILSTRLCASIWPPLEVMYTPWIAPLWTEQLEEPVASWIDQLTDDRSVMLPWIPPDKQHASRAVMMFIEGVRFVLDTLSCDVLSYLWQFYVNKFAHNSIIDHVLSVVHAHLVTLPWQQFRPVVQDMDLMYKVITQSVPSEVYTLLGNIFISVSWVRWFHFFKLKYKDNYEVQTKIHVYMLHLYVKMAKEKEVRKMSKINEMLATARKFDWHLVDAAAYGQVVDWWVFKYDPRVAAGLKEPYINPVDKCVMNLLEVAAGFTTEVQLLHPTTLHKRIFFVRGMVKMLLKCTNDDRTFVDNNVNDVSVVIYSLLSSIENITQRTVREEMRLEECTLLVKEVVVIFNQPENSELKKLAVKVCSSWLQKENCISFVVQGFLQVVGTDVTSPVTMGQLLETCLTTYFKTTVVQVSIPSWRSAAQLLTAPTVPHIEDALLNSGSLLTLHALLYKQMSTTKSGREEVTLLTNLVDWICQVKPSEMVESKLPLLWGITLLVIHRQCECNESLASITRSIRRLITHFLETSEEKGQFWNLLGTLGLRKTLVMSLKGRLLCRAMAVFLLAQLPEGGNEQLALRISATSPGAITSSRESTSVEGGPIPTGDAMRGLRDLEALASAKSHLELKDTVELAVTLIKDPAQSIKTAKEVLGALTAQLYTEQYLHILTKFN